MSKIPVGYSTNNSGGSYWLKDKDWKALAKAGWKLYRFNDFAYKDGDYIPDKNGLPSKKDEVPVNKQDQDKWGFGSDATYHYAYKLFPNIHEALQEFEKLTGQDVTEEGCNCCGAPHSFTWGRDIIVRIAVDKQDYHYASGEELGEYLLDTDLMNLSKRELVNRLVNKI